MVSLDDELSVPGIVGGDEGREESAGAMNVERSAEIRPEQDFRVHDQDRIGIEPGGCLDDSAAGAQDPVLEGQADARERLCRVDCGRRVRALGLL